MLSTVGVCVSKTSDDTDFSRDRLQSIMNAYENHVGARMNWFGNIAVGITTFWIETLTARLKVCQGNYTSLFVLF